MRLDLTCSMSGRGDTLFRILHGMLCKQFKGPLFCFVLWRHHKLPQGKALSAWAATHAIQASTSTMKPARVYKGTLSCR